MVKVLSYNIYFKAMMNKSDCVSCMPLVGGYTKCLDNVSKIIQSYGPYDFVCLQEATNWRTIHEITPTLQEMAAVSQRFDLEEMVIFYDQNKFKLDERANRLVGYMADRNRPFVILFFQGNLCVINVHAGHHYDIYRFNRYLQQALEGASAEFLPKLKTYDIIMMGDFNNELKKGFSILGRRMYGINQTLTCCDKSLENKKQRSAFDHVLSTYPHENQSIVIPTVDASDHLPILSILTKKIGYDFDGVLHTDVGVTDKIGQRNPHKLHGEYNVFDEIVDHILIQISWGYQVNIITARNNNKAHLTTIQNHLKRTKLEPYMEDIPIYFTGGNKVSLIRELGINAFYDDSCIRITEIQEAREYLPNLVQLYFADPDSRSWKLIVNESDINCKQLMVQLGGAIESNESIESEMLDQCINLIYILATKGYPVRNKEIDWWLEKLDNATNWKNNLENVSQIQWHIIRLVHDNIKHIGKIDYVNI